MDLGEPAHQVKFRVRDRCSDFTAAFDAVLVGARDPDRAVQRPGSPVNAIAERWIGGCRREVLDRTLIWNQAICGGSCVSTRTTTISTGRAGP
jgi:hypothetical protein